MTTLSVEGPSGQGLSHWSDPCRRHAFLRGNSSLGNSYTGIAAMDIGTIFHTLVAQWYREGNSFQASKSKLSPPPEKDVWAIGLNTFLHYRKDMKTHEHLGKVVEVETVRSHGHIDIKPDLLITVNQKAIEKRTGYKPAAGIWAPDHKVIAIDEKTGDLYSGTRAYYASHLRCALYPYILRKAGIDCQGYMMNLIAKYPNKGYWLLVVPYNEGQHARAEAFFNWSAEIAKLGDMANPAECSKFDFGKRSYKYCEFSGKNCWGY